MIASTLYAYWCLQKTNEYADVGIGWMIMSVVEVGIYMGAFTLGRLIMMWTGGC